MHEAILKDLEDQVRTGQGHANRQTGKPQYFGQTYETMFGTVGVYPSLSRISGLIKGLTYTLNGNNLKKKQLLEILNGGSCPVNTAYKLFCTELRIKKEKQQQKIRDKREKG